MKLSSTNNFDLIRLFAASQVAITHTAKHLDLDFLFLRWLAIFPGVPIFFFISGFLIYGSYEKSLSGESAIRNFYLKRILRLYPALWFCLLFTLIILLGSGYLLSVSFSAREFIGWLLASSTFFQFYNPEFLRGFGVGAINGSLWTIAVELQFYILTPVLFILLRRKWSVVTAVVLVFVCLNLANSQFNTKEHIFEKLLGVSFLPWLYMFLLGAFSFKYQRILELVARIPFPAVLSLYLISYFLTHNLGWGNRINPLGFISLAALVLKLAITKPTLADSLLRRNDISYGIYIFHMPIVNLLIFREIRGPIAFGAGLVFTVALASISWFLVERPALRLKSRELRSN